MPLNPDALVESYKVKCTEEVKGWRARRNLKNDLTEKAQNAHRIGNYEGSFDLFCHLLGAIEADPSTTAVSEMRATIMANIGSALQFMGEEELSKVRLAPSHICFSTGASSIAVPSCPAAHWSARLACTTRQRARPIARNR